MTDYHAGTGAGEADLENALSNLQKGDRVFITFDDYAQYHSHGGEEPHEFNDIGKLALAHLALAYGCVAKLEDAERRIYFSKI
jgi:hypothetical protein